jgi:hypothetical protein
MMSSVASDQVGALLLLLLLPLQLLQYNISMQVPRALCEM